MQSTSNHPPTDAETESRPASGGERPGFRLKGSLWLVLGIIFFPVIFVMLGLILMVLLQPAKGALDGDQLTQARTLWEASRPPAYEATLQISGNNSGEITIRQLPGEPPQVKHEPESLAQTAEGAFYAGDSWGIEALFDRIANDMELMQQPEYRPPPGMLSVEPRAVFQAQFDPRYGYPTRYRCQKLGPQPALEWQIKQFEVLRKPPADAL